eukprot:m.228436 g.228436  ORF g.228436 m.228436 type:complete len:620 (+) comp11741_c0_seq1:42-1901(+)
MDTVTVAGAAASVLAVTLGAVYWRFIRLDGKVDPSEKKHGGQLVAEVLKAHGVPFVFTLVGGHISPILVACKEIGIRVVDTRHEVTTVFAADAVSRLSGIPGVAIVTAGPGLTNTVTAIKNAQMAESPVILLGGAAVTLLKGRGSLQDIDQMALFKPLCKYCATITRVKDIVPTLRKAFQIAQSGVPGPVFIEFPIDTLYPFPTVLKEAIPQSKKPEGAVQQLVNWYLKHHVESVFAGGFEQHNLTPIPPSIPMPSASNVSAAIKLIREAKRPVFVIGSQAVLPPVKADDLRAALERLGVPCYLGGMSRGLLGKQSPIQMRQDRKDALREADVVILAGAVCDFRLSYGRVLNRKSKIIAVNRDRTAMLRNSDMFWTPTLAVAGDVGTFVMQIATALAGENYKVAPEWIAKLRERDDAKEAQNLTRAKEPMDRHMNPLQVLLDFEAALPENSILVADGGDFVGSAAYILRPRGPLCWLDPGAFGTLGCGGGFALGAKLVRPDMDVWIIYGDGSLGYSVAEYDTFTRHKIPVASLIGNDACWSQIAREQVPMFGTDVACALDYTPYETVAQGFGGVGFAVKSQGDVPAVLAAAQAALHEGKSVLVNALIGKSNFRQGSISV